MPAVTAVLEKGLDGSRTLQVSATIAPPAFPWLSGGAVAASRGLAEINGKVLDLVRAQTESVFSLWKQLSTVTSLSEAVQLQTRHLRRHYEDTAARAKDIAETATRVTSEALEQAKKI